uniref:G-protein coupled receptors family 1 profile domain-containing protein n=1 Tax=Amphiprion ocellaris TaxID=80972 RepID=A0AAQ6AGI0_AMPOC
MQCVVTKSTFTGSYFNNASTRVQSILGNALVILAFKVDKSLRRQCNYYFLNLAISDFLVVLILHPCQSPWTLDKYY